MYVCMYFSRSNIARAVDLLIGYVSEVPMIRVPGVNFVVLFSFRWCVICIFFVWDCLLLK